MSGSPGEALKEGSPIITDEHIDNFGISFSTAAPGKPHYIKISYAPGWRSSGGEKIYPVSPGFMLIYPKGTKVSLNYRRSGWEIAGIVLSLLSIPFAFIITKKRPERAFPWRAFLAAGLGLFFGMALYLSAQSLVGYPALARAMAKARRIDPGDFLRRKELLALVDPWATRENLDRYDNRLVFDAYRLKSLVLAAEGQQKKLRSSSIPSAPAMPIPGFSIPCPRRAEGFTLVRARPAPDALPCTGRAPRAQPCPAAELVIG